MRKPNIDFLKRVKEEKIVDTRNYRYYCNGDGKITRVPICYLDHTGWYHRDKHKFICYEREVR